MKRQDDFQEKISPDSKLDIFYGMYTKAFIFPVWFKQIAKHITVKRKKKITDVKKGGVKVGGADRYVYNFMLLLKQVIRNSLLPGKSHGSSYCLANACLPF